MQKDKNELEIKIEENSIIIRNYQERIKKMTLDLNANKDYSSNDDEEDKIKNRDGKLLKIKINNKKIEKQFILKEKRERLNFLQKIGSIISSSYIKKNQGYFDEIIFGKLTDIETIENV